MRVTATHLVHWSDERVAQDMLPVLVRRLISTTAQTTALAMPGGDSVNLPGWDGVIKVAKGNAWVPDGFSYWEIGTSKDPASKARSDFNKRGSELSDEDKAQSTFVFVTSRRWPGKATWQADARAKKTWADVLVWDADDLEAWLEISAGTSLWLGIQLRIAGHGIDSVENYWENWRNQSKPTMTAAALFSGREQLKDKLREQVEQHSPLIAVMADSQSEAVAFICALLVEEGHSQRAACITSEEGWQFIDANPGIELVIVTDNQLGNHRAPRNGFSKIVPLASGDQSFNLMGIGAKAADQTVIELSRPQPDDFEKSLLSLGLASTDAARYAKIMGRSWTVFRRWHAVNPAIQKPAWLDTANTSSLQVLTLVGAWNGASEGDRVCIAQIANKPYEDIENELLGLAALDDAPVLKIGTLWKAKAPLELLHLMAPRLTGTILSRFFQVARVVFEKPDPVLELEEDKRWMASIYGKVREHSGVVLDAMADSIAKLGYFADSGAGAESVGNDVRGFIHQLLGQADEERWLSISPYLVSLAEAAPDEFLSAVRSSLHSPRKSVLRLITETQSSGTLGRCWHATLLWALELSAWYPLRLNRVASILTELSDMEVKGNWANTPFNSLVSLFRPWYPQTAAPVELRLRVVSDLVNKQPHTGWKLLVALAPNHPDMASPNAKPRWRDDDAGAGDGVTHEEYRQFVLAIARLLVKNASDHAARIAELVPMIDRLDTAFRDTVINLVSTATGYCDEDRELIRAAVREFLSWENSFNKDAQKHDRYVADALRPAFDALAADDLVIRHAWIFTRGWVDLPDGREEEYEEEDRIRARLRSTAVREVYEKQGWQGIGRLARHCGDSWLVGWELANPPFERNDLIQWLCQWYMELQEPSFDTLTSGVLHAVPQAENIEFLVACLHQLEQLLSPPATIAGFMSNAQQAMPLWRLVETQPPEVYDLFWRTVRPYCPHSESDDLIYCIEKLLVAERPRAAMEAIISRADHLPSELLVQILKRLAAGQEAEASPPPPWQIARVFKALNTKQLPQSDLAGLELAYYDILHQGKYETPNLMTAILESPEFFMELICLVYKPRHSEREPLPENRRAAAKTASSLLHNARGTPGINSDGSIDKDLFFAWICKVRDLAREQDRSVITDETIGVWLSDWPCKKNLEHWPAPIIAELLDQEGCEYIRRGFLRGVCNKRGFSSRMPYDGGSQEREIAHIFKGFAVKWKSSKPNLAAMIESLAKSYEQEAKRHDEDGRWSQEE